MGKSELGGLLSYAAAHWPSRTALRNTDGLSISYFDYLRQADEVAGNITRKFPGAESVCILADKSIASLILTQGVLRAGACYIPLNPFATFQKNYAFFEESSFDVLIAEAKDAPPDILNERSIERIEILDRVFLMISGNSGSSRVEKGNCAYILCTSGSTGHPKGVMMSHDSALYFLDWCSHTFGPGPADVFASIAPWCFDLSILDIFLPIMHGSCLVVFGAEEIQNAKLIVRYMHELEISRIYATPTFYKSLEAFGHPDQYNYGKIKTVLFAGEVFPIRPLNRLRRLWHRAEFYNLYGPTETNVCTFFKLPGAIEENRDSPYPIGKPCAGTEYMIKEGGVSGILLISGPGVMSGYYRDESGTRLKLYPDAGGKMWYDTGDEVTLSDDGNLIFTGRADRQIKRKGYRIELDEIESAISRYENVVECAAIAQQSEEGNTVTAFVVSNVTNGFSLRALREYLVQTMENYKMPDKFVICDTLPKTASGKINYQQLKDM